MKPRYLVSHKRPGPGHHWQFIGPKTKDGSWSLVRLVEDAIDHGSREQAEKCAAAFRENPGETEVDEV